MSRNNNHRNDACPVSEAQSLIDALNAPDASARARAVRAICPCRMGWNAYEQSITLVRRLCKDPDPNVRAAALHVIEDALEMENSGLPTNPRENTDEMLAARRRSRFARDTDSSNTLPAQDTLRRERTRQREQKHEAGKAFRRPAANR